MSNIFEKIQIDWMCKDTWRRASYNTLWCLVGCSIGDMGTIAFFQFSNFQWSTFNIMCLAIFNGLITSIILETIILLRQMSFELALKTALGMSLLSMPSGWTWGSMSHRKDRRCCVRRRKKKLHGKTKDSERRDRSRCTDHRWKCLWWSRSTVKRNKP